MDEKIRIAVILSGSGVFDGSEIHEATLTLYAIDKYDADYVVFAPNIEQYHVINHINGEVMDETRNVLVESARIARGKIKDLKEFDANDFHALMLPGGFGAAKNLSTFAFDGINCDVDPDVEKAVRSMNGKGKPIGALCIAPVLITKILGGIEVTIGQDDDTAEAIEEMGGHHTNTDHGDIVIDHKNLIVTSPCYMLDATISQIGKGADNVVEALLGLV